MSTLDDFIRDFVPRQPVFTLAEVAALTGNTVDVLAEACRRGEIEHQFRGRRRVLTYPQLVKLLKDTHRPEKATVQGKATGTDRVERHRASVAARLAKRGAA